MIRINLCLFLIFLVAVISSSASAGVEGFIEITPYAQDSKEFSCANMSADEWAVRIEKNKLVIVPAKRRNTVTLDVAGGSFIAKDGGEFEGGLSFNQGKEHQTLFNENISALFSISNDTVVAFGGLAHLETDDGYMLIIKKRPKAFGWKVEKRVPLPANPYAVAATDPERFYFVTGEGLYSIHWPTEKIDKLKSSYVTRLYPNSLAMDQDKHIYVGMRHAVVHFIPVAGGGYDIKWLVKSRCTR